MGGANLCFRDGEGVVRCAGEWPVRFATATSSGMRNHSIAAWHTVGGLRPARALGLSTGRGCAVHGDGTVSCWGNTELKRSTWVGAEAGVLDASPVAELAGVKHVAVGSRGSCALHRDGSVSCWGPYFSGREEAPQPVLHPRRLDLDDVIQLDAALDRACALQSDGRLSCWGERREKAGPEDPIAVAGLPPVTQVSLGWHHSCALTRDGEIWCWGENDEGQLGDGTTDTRPAPVPVVGLPPATQVVVSRTGDFSCALTRERQVLCWGSNANCAVGNHDAPACRERMRRSTFGDLRTIHCPAPQSVDVPLVPDRLVASSTIGCAQSEQGEVACWGRPLEGGPPRCRGTPLPLEP